MDLVREFDVSILYPLIFTFYFSDGLEYPQTVAFTSLRISYLIPLRLYRLIYNVSAVAIYFSLRLVVRLTCHIGFEKKYITKSQVVLLSPSTHTQRTCTMDQFGVQVMQLSGTWCSVLFMASNLQFD